MNIESCGYKCLVDTRCFTATFNVNTGQCTLYFEKTIVSQIFPSSNTNVLSVYRKIPNIAQLIPLLSPSNSIFTIWNSGAGRSSTASSQGLGYGQYPPWQSAIVAIDGLRNTTYVNYGNTSQYVSSLLGGIGTGFYVITNLGAPSILLQFRVATGSDFPIRDPFVVTIEGSNGGNLTQGSSWTLIYNGSTGLETDPGRRTFGPLQSTPTTEWFTYYRFLTVAVRSTADCAQYSEVELYGYLINKC